MLANGELPLPAGVCGDREDLKYPVDSANMIFLRGEQMLNIIISRKPVAASFYPQDWNSLNTVIMLSPSLSLFPLCWLSYLWFANNSSSFVFVDCKLATCVSSALSSSEALSVTTGCLGQYL